MTHTKGRCMIEAKAMRNEVRDFIAQVKEHMDDLNWLASGKPIRSPKDRILLQKCASIVYVTILLDDASAEAGKATV